MKWTCLAPESPWGVRAKPVGGWMDGYCYIISGRAGTVTTEVAKVINEYKAGKVEFRNDAGGNVHAIVGKLSFQPEKLQENAQAFVDRIMSMKPATVKGQYLKGITISATMSPGVKVAA